MSYARQFTLRTPAPVSSVSLADTNHLAVGSDDGTVRFYELPSPKVVKAIRGLECDVASIAWTKKDTGGQGPHEVWIGSGPTVHIFRLDSSKLIMGKEAAYSNLSLGQDKEDVLNGLSISDNQKHLAFSTDAGTVGVVDLPSCQIMRMKASHTLICSSVKFIPDRPSEIVSGGYDSALIHFDFKQGSLSSRFDIAAAPPTSGVSLSPPFILSLSVSSTGLVAATTADGRIWLGTGADKSSPAIKKKRSRKWEGLRESGGIFSQVADGPIVASAFTTPSTLITCTLLGKISQHIVSYDEEQIPRLETKWTATVVDLAKVNELDAAGEWMTVGGFSEDGKGCVEIWKLAKGPISAEQ
ncbi:WD40-repeat-containing domain protein [Cytidiella melzeri]|nr:WD40-repeat-containing domain protein [Cytidiella melzeri]